MSLYTGVMVCVFGPPCINLGSQLTICI